MSITNNNESNVADVVVQILTSWLEHGGQEGEISPQALSQAVASAGGNPVALQTMDLSQAYAQACQNAGYEVPQHPPATIERVVQEVKHVQEINEYHTEINNIDNSQNVNNNLDLSGADINTGGGDFDLNFDPTSATGGSVAGGTGSTVTGATFGGVANSGPGDVTAATGSGNALSGNATLADNGSTAVGADGILATSGAIVADDGSSAAAAGGLSILGPNSGNANTGQGAVLLGGTFTQTANGGAGGAATANSGGATGGEGLGSEGGRSLGSLGGGGDSGAATGGAAASGAATATAGGGGGGGTNTGPFSGPINISTGAGAQQVDQSHSEGSTSPTVHQFGTGVGDQVAQSPGAVIAHGPVTATNSQIGGEDNNNANATENILHTPQDPTPDYVQPDAEPDLKSQDTQHHGSDDQHIHIDQNTDHHPHPIEIIPS